MSKLLLVRHGETAKNSQGLLHDFFDEEVLTAKGRQQILATAQYLASFSPDIILSSQEKRAIESSKILSSELSVPFTDVPDLHERNWGQMSGRPVSDMQHLLDSMSFDERYTYVPPDGESWQTFEQRLISAIKNLVNSHPHKNIIVVTHGSSIRVLLPWLLNAPKQESFIYDPVNASVSVFEVLSPDHYEKVVVDNSSHLSSTVKQ